MLNFIRLITLVAASVAARLTGRARFAWLAHYLAGSGRDKWVSQEDLEQVLPALAGQWRWATEEYSVALVRRARVKGGTLDRIGFWSTTLYEGRGFWGRPEVFYTLGCFTFTVKQIRDPYTGDEIVTVEGADRYDWHSTTTWEGEEAWYTTPLPLWAARVLGALFGREYFPTEGFPMGEPGISNRLWADLEKVGARPFKSRFRTSLPLEKWQALAYPEEEG